MTKTKKQTRSTRRLAIVQTKTVTRNFLAAWSGGDTSALGLGEQIDAVVRWAIEHGITEDYQRRNIEAGRVA